MAAWTRAFAALACATRRRDPPTGAAWPAWMQALAGRRRRRRWRHPRAATGADGEPSRSAAGCAAGLGEAKAASSSRCSASSEASSGRLREVGRGHAEDGPFCRWPTWSMPPAWSRRWRSSRSKNASGRSDDLCERFSLGGAGLRQPGVSRPARSHGDRYDRGRGPGTISASASGWACRRRSGCVLHPDLTGAEHFAPSQDHPPPAAPRNADPRSTRRLRR